MNLIRWVKRWLTHRGKALALYRAGMAKAKKGDYDGAIADYSAAILAPDIPTDVKAMATYNRALAYSAIQEDAKAAEDLAAMLEMPGLSEEIKTAAQNRRVRVKMRHERAKKEDNPQ
jgi:tetratricopeptide (TPR) repeat protein